MSKKQDEKEEAAPEIKTLEDIPGSMFDPNVVRAAAIRQLKEMEDRHNFNRRVWFLRAVENWILNRRHNSALVQPVPQPPLAVHYQYVENPKGGNNEPIMTEGPDLVAEPYTPPEPPEPTGPLPEGVVAFGPPAEDGTGSFLVAANNTVPPGTHAIKGGTEYVLIQLGRIGTMMYRKLWVPVSAE